MSTLLTFEYLVQLCKNKDQPQPLSNNKDASGQKRACSFFLFICKKNSYLFYITLQKKKKCVHCDCRWDPRCCSSWKHTYGAFSVWPDEVAAQVSTDRAFLLYFQQRYCYCVNLYICSFKHSDSALDNSSSTVMVVIAWCWDLRLAVCPIGLF